MSKKQIIIVLLFVPCLLRAQGIDNTESRIDSMIGQMTIEQKLGQLTQMDGRGDLQKLEKEVREGKLTSIMNIVDPEVLNSLQRIAVEQSPTGIPLLFARDIVHGFRTVLPIPLGQAASFDEELVGRASRNTAVEATRSGIRWAFAPMVDIARDPRWGRMAEGFGEDTYLAGRLGSAVVRGYQGNSLAEAASMAACAKHFVAYGAAEGGRDYNTTYVTERQLRDTYLPPFKECVDAGCASIMSSFNDNDGLPSTANRHLLTDILRDEWGFDGVVVSDWGSVGGLVPHGVAANKREAAKKSILAGTDVDMSSRSYIAHLASLVESGEVPVESVDEAVRRVLRLKMRLGLFEAPFTDNNQKQTDYKAEILNDARLLAEESAVLLKNDGTLPIDPSVKTILVTGPMADAPFDQLGTWSLDGDKAHTITPIKALQQEYGQRVEIVYYPALSFCRDRNTDAFKRLKKLARKADLIIAFVGEESIMSGEAHSLSNLTLQGAQSELLELLASTAKPLVTVVMAGRPLSIGRAAELSSSLMYFWHPGTMGGAAIARLLFGDAAPSGKLPVTFPREVGQIPTYYGRKHTSHINTKPDEVLLDKIPLEAVQSVMGHTSSYLDLQSSPLYPFGYGLSYTTFKIDDLQLVSTEIALDGTIELSVRVTNTGNRKGTEVVQVYITDKVAQVTRPMKELKAFRRVELLPEGSERVTFTIAASELAYCGLDMKQRVDPGEYTVTVGTDSTNGLSADFRLAKCVLS